MTKFYPLLWWTCWFTFDHSWLLETTIITFILSALQLIAKTSISNEVFMFMKNMLWVAIPSHLCLYNLCCSILLHKELGHLFPKINAQVQTLCGQHFHLFHVICQSVLVFKTWGKWTSCNTTSVILYAIKFLVYADVIIVIIVFFSSSCVSIICRWNQHNYYSAHRNTNPIPSPIEDSASLCSRSS